MVQAPCNSSFWDTDSLLAIQETIKYFMELEGFLPHSQAPSPVPIIKLYESCLYLCTLFL